MTGRIESCQNLIRCNQLLHFRGHHYRYDEHGRTASKQTIGTTQHYHYDADHRLSEVRIEQTAAVSVTATSTTPLAGVSKNIR
ncbi:RHS repeat protein [Snodgrassella sp. ESL0323]|nr:RHS repeat protein [Snodgrassella sp. ESL0323]